MKRRDYYERHLRLKIGDLISVTVGGTPHVGRYWPMPYSLYKFGLRYPDGVEQRFHFNEIDDIKIIRRRNFPGAGKEVKPCL